MNTVSGDLDQECERFLTYLLGVQPDPYVIQKYREAHQSSHRAIYVEGTTFDRFLLWLATCYGWGVKVADAYCSIFYKGSLLRRKLVLVVAICECSPKLFRIIDRPEEGALVHLAVKSVGYGVTFLCSFLASIPLVMPVHIILSLGAKTSR